MSRKAILSALWIFVMFHYLYADFGMIVLDPGLYQGMAAGMSGAVMLGSAVLLEIPMFMILLSRVLTYRANRWANILAGLESSVWVAWSLFIIPPAFSYMFSAIIEIACTLFIVWYAWTWPNPDSLSVKAALDRGDS